MGIHALLIGLTLLWILGVACIALALYWLARGYIWDSKLRSKAVQNAKFDVMLALVLLVPVYGLAWLNSQNCWLDGSVGLPGLAYHCDDGLRKTHPSHIDWDKM